MPAKRLFIVGGALDEVDSSSLWTGRVGSSSENFVSLPPPPPPRMQKKKRVSFDSVHVHEHRLVLGDNPAVSSGLPVALGRKQGERKVDLERYEQELLDRGKKPARKLTKEQRDVVARNSTSLLLSPRSIKKVQDQVDAIKESRQEALMGLLRRRQQASSRDDSSPVVLVRMVQWQSMASSRDFAL